MAKKDVVTESIPPKVVKVSEELYCSLNPVEWNSRAQELADAQKEAEPSRRAQEVGYGRPQCRHQNGTNQSV